MAFMKGRVVNKRARWNLCFADYDQEPDYENKRGRIVDFKNIPLTQKLRKKFAKVIGDKGNDLMGEGNYYYNSSECGIGFHGDAERRKVVGVRLGASMPLEFQWYCGFKRVGKRRKFVLNHGDVYIMSQKAVGTDWKRSSVSTLRHAAGCAKFLK